ncbi:MAG: cytochrome c3 family protein [Bacteroidetes bacterium]|nr:cytochrome c3 family protein [Bacteroidota bacterium]
MKKLTALFAITIFLCTSVNAQSVVASKHDLSMGGGITNKSSNETQVCIFCHTPHQKTLTAKPLWNKALSAQATYGTYTSTSLTTTTVADIGGGTGVSNLCMSCHDGTVGVNSLDNKSSFGQPAMGSGTELDINTGKIAATREAYMGVNLSNDHPINFTYDAALATADPGLKSPNSANYVDATHEVPLYTGSLQCASCHNPHNNAQGTFLRVSNAGSALCLKCHTK